MDSPEAIEAKLDEIEGSQYITKDTKQYITDNLTGLKEYANKTEYKHINTVIKIVNQPKKHNANDRKEIQKANKFIINIVKRYAEEYEEQPNEDNIEEDLATNEIEETLDSKIPTYSGFSENHPMEGITWDKTNKTFKIQLNGTTKTNKNLDSACQILKEKFQKESPEISVKLSFAYGNHFFMSYWINNEPYFDIQHIISVLNLKKSSWNDKYNEFGNDIVHYIWHQNEFNGYILRELISEKTMYELLLSSNSDFSKKMKKDVADILVSLRKNNKLTLTNEKLGVKQSKKIHKNLLSINQQPIYTYDNPLHLQYMNNLITFGTQFPISSIHKKHILYLCIIQIPTKHNDIIIKFGYSEDIITRIGTLKTEYKSPVFFVTGKVISGRREEFEFHEILKAKYEYLIEKYKTTKTTKGKSKVELYKFSPILLKEYHHYLNNDDNKEDELSKINEHEIVVANTFNLNNTPLDSNHMLKFLAIREKHIHEKIMEDKKVRLEMEKMKHEKEKMCHEKEMMDKKLLLQKQGPYCDNNNKIGMDTEIELLCAQNEKDNNKKPKVQKRAETQVKPTAKGKRQIIKL